MLTNLTTAPMETDVEEGADGTKEADGNKFQKMLIIFRKWFSKSFPASPRLGLPENGCGSGGIGV